MRVYIDFYFNHLQPKREALGDELSRFDQDVPQLKIDGESHRRVLRCETTYHSAVGPV